MSLEDEDAATDRVSVERFDDGWTVCLDGAACGYWANHAEALEEANALRRDIVELERRFARRRRKWCRRTRLIDSYAAAIRAEYQTDRDYTYWLMRRRGVSVPEMPLRSEPSQDRQR